MKRVLVIAYYFPPMGLSGVQRIARFVKYLPETGWAPTVLTVEPAGYFAFDEALLAELHRPEINIVRVASIDPTRFFGKKSTVSLPAEGSRRWMSYLSQLLFVPDNKIGWIRPATARAETLQAAAPFDAVFASIPPYSGALIAARFARRHNLPLVVDYRDDWLGNPRHIYPTPLHRRLHRRLERRVVRQADALLAINDRIADALARRAAAYVPGETRRPPVQVMPQGFDPADFKSMSAQAYGDRGRLQLLYSGVFYDVQTPDFFLRSLAAFLAQRPEARSKVEASFLGLVPAASKALIGQLGLADVVGLEGYRPHQAVIEALQAADVLWMTVGRGKGQETISTSKLFEYMGARKPILGLVPEGAARDALQTYGASFIAPPDDEQAILAQLTEIYSRWEQNRLPEPDEVHITQFDRSRLTVQLGELLDRLAINRNTA